jgi:putative flavoprotein involved in K+ transport
MPTDVHSRTTDVLVLGAGPAGLACAVLLGERGVAVTLLEQGEAVGAAWSGRYRCLRLNSGRPFSALPGQRYPRGTPMFPTRDQVVRYLQDYADGLDVRTGTRVLRLDPQDGRWRVTTDAGPWTAAQVVVATGLLAEPVLPPALSSSPVPLVHSGAYVDGAPYRGRSVLVVGAGSSGFEIAHDLVEHGAARVRLSVRTPPNVLPRAVGGLSGDPAVLVLQHLPPRVADLPLRLLRRLTIGDLSEQGLPLPAQGPFTRLALHGAAPSEVDPEVIDDLRAGRVEVVAGVARTDEVGVHLDDGSTLEVDVVIAATGFRSGLEPLVGHLGVLDERGVPIAFDESPALPGLHFVNFALRPGLLGAAGSRARRTAAAVAREAVAAR